MTMSLSWFGLPPALSAPRVAYAALGLLAAGAVWRRVRRPVVQTFWMLRIGLGRALRRRRPPTVARQVPVYDSDDEEAFVAPPPSAGWKCE